MVKQGQGNVPKLKFNLFSSAATDWTLLWWGTSPSDGEALRHFWHFCELSSFTSPYIYPVCKINKQLFNTYFFWLLTFFSPISLILVDSGILHSTRQIATFWCSTVLTSHGHLGINLNKEVCWSLKALAEKWRNKVSHKTLSTDLKWTNNTNTRTTWDFYLLFESPPAIWAIRVIHFCELPPLLHYNPPSLMAIFQPPPHH